MSAARGRVPGNYPRCWLAATARTTAPPLMQGAGRFVLRRDYEASSFLGRADQRPEPRSMSWTVPRETPSVAAIFR